MNKMDQLPQFKTKLCKYGEQCWRLPRGTCTYAHSTEEQRTYINPWINAEYGVVTLQNNAIIHWYGSMDKEAAIETFVEAARLQNLAQLETTTCKDSFLFLKFPHSSIVLTGLPRQDNAHILDRFTAPPTHSLLGSQPHLPASSPA